MSSKSSVYIRSRHRTFFWPCALSAASLFVVVAYLFLRNIHPFLAINEPVNADVMIVEGWVPEYVVDAAIGEYVSGSYQKVYVSGLESAGPAADGSQVVRHMLRSGVEPSTITLAAAPPTRWNRTSSMARAVSQAIRRSGQPLSAVNVVTLGPHGRQSRLAYQRILGRNTVVGVISIPKDDYDSRRWWASEAGIRKTLKDFVGWLREFVFGPRN